MTSLWSYTQIEIDLPNGGRSVNHFGKEHDDSASHYRFEDVIFGHTEGLLGVVHDQCVFIKLQTL
jgi:hypothetical protein